jgi:hypothetical protein
LLLLRIGKLVRAGSVGCEPREAPTNHPASRTMASIAAAVVCASAALVTAIPSADADPIAATRSQIADQQNHLVAAAEHIRQLTSTYEQDSTRAQTLAQQVAADQASLESVQAQLARTVVALRAEAIADYTGRFDETTMDTGGSITDPAVKAVYVQFATGEQEQILDSYHLQLRQVTSARDSLVRQSDAATDAVKLTTSARQEAIDQATALQTSFNQLQGRLAQLVADDAKAKAANKAEPAPPVTPSGPPTNQGVVRTVRSIVAPAPTTATTAAPRQPAKPPAVVEYVPPPTSPPTTSPPSHTSPSGGAPTSADWYNLRVCESGDNYQENTGNGYYGAYQFAEQSWMGLGLPGRPDLAPPSVQDAAAAKLQAEVGWGAWPACSRLLGL